MSANHWNWDHLRYFLALADCGTLTAAGRELNVSHTTVLRRIKAFELSLQARLFEHTASGYLLTDAGAVLRAQAIQLKASLDAAARDVVKADQKIAGEVLIATTDSLAFHLLPPLIRKLTDLHPELILRIQMNTQLNNMQKREADIAIRTCREPPDTLIGRHIGFVNFSACASPDYILRHKLKHFPLPTESHQYIVLDASFEGVPFYDWMVHHMAEKGRCVEVNNFLLAKAMCEAGVGITVLPTYMLGGDCELTELPTRAPIGRNPLWILSHSELRDTARMRLVRQFLYDALSTHFQSVQKSAPEQSNVHS